MATRVLVAYGTRNGSTAGIATMIADTLRDEGIDAETWSADQVGALDPYDAVVLGGALYAGRWHRDAARFARRNRRALSGMPVWLFSSGPLDSSASARVIPPVAGAARALTRLDAHEHVTFGGRLEPGARGTVARMIISQGRGGDFRDREQITAWARGIARVLTAARAG